MKYIAFLRGINVGGHRIIKMDALRAMFNQMGFKEVGSYIQSGNVIFNSRSENGEQLTSWIETYLEKELGYAVVVMLRTFDELKAVADNCPFDDSDIEKHEKIYITFLKEEADQEHAGKIEGRSNALEHFRVVGKELFAHCIKNKGKLQFSNMFVEKILKTSATTRNITSVRAILRKY